MSELIITSDKGSYHLFKKDDQSIWLSDGRGLGVKIENVDFYEILSKHLQAEIWGKAG